ncbi:MAG: hypothetical protein KF734_00075 [Saprospiraceae bacterium]|nr:hypothetical protein [Saprospiraceae bacterium]
MLMLLRCAAVNAQQAGVFTISGFVNDPATATTRCTINWENLFYSSVHLLSVDISVDGVEAVCLNDLPQAPGIYGILVQTSAGQRSLRFVKL